MGIQAALRARTGYCWSVLGGIIGGMVDFVTNRTYGLRGAHTTIRVDKL